MATAQVNGVSIEYEVDGPRDGEPMLLIMGLGAQLVVWPPDLVQMLTTAGFRVIRPDNRDIGLSSKTEAPLPRTADVVKALGSRRLARSSYTLSDMAADKAALLDHLGIRAAHVVGVSMGAMIAQQLAIDVPEAVLSLTSIMSNTGNPRYGRISPRLIPSFTRSMRTPEPADREAAVRASLAGYRNISGPHFDEDEMRSVVEAGMERDTDSVGTSRQLLAIRASADRTPGLRRLTVPTLVIHGLLDKLVLPSGGIATARAVPGSRLLMFPDMAHDLPKVRRREIADAIIANAARAATSARATGLTGATRQDWAMPVHLWLRHEARPTERRAPVVPSDARRLVEAGLRVTVEESPQRVFPIEEYAAAGADIAPSGSWVGAPDDVYVLGVKELPDEPDALAHHHVYFAHAFKGQPGAEHTLRRFEQGGGRLHDVEYLTDEAGRRVVAFGYWAGYVGASLGLLQLSEQLTAPLAPTTSSDLEERLRRAGEEVDAGARALVIGAAGRSGRGACDALAVAGVATTRWDQEETQRLDKPALLGHALLVNCVHSAVPTTPFVEEGDLVAPGRLRVVADVTCDVGAPTNLVPLNDEVTSWTRPVRRFGASGMPPVDVIAVDNLPSLLPREASEVFSGDLTPQLVDLAAPAPTAPWLAARAAYDRAVQRLS